MDEGGRKEEILKAAQTIFSQYGYHQATIRMIADQAQCATGTFYLYFVSKQDCFLALVEKLYTHVMEHIMRARSGIENPAEKLKRSLEAAVDVFRRDYELAQVVLVRGAGADPLFEERMWRVREAFSEFIVSDLIECGVPQPQAVIGAHGWVGALAEIVGVWIRRDQDLDLNEAAQEIQRIFWTAWGLNDFHSAS
ncbi:TetR/AcrR family transcriptional regulator [Sulfobacillus thermosulfidooxidans]|uniref:TetR/AcrR family transcriptional regulator n=1 Tax=Sulfobacillus thermosulfidooxidans TaxID=28034 RepID=UPI0006B5DE72|nr:TetR/AcrR family transcriptional regulator [Sulfobacillus thermosulfidooxidans]